MPSKKFDSPPDLSSAYCLGGSHWACHGTRVQGQSSMCYCPCHYPEFRGTWVCHHFSHEVVSPNWAPMRVLSARQRDSIRNYHTKHKLKRRDDFPYDKGLDGPS